MKQLFLIGILLLAFSCNKDRPSAEVCQVDDPLNELGWLTDRVSRYSTGSAEVFQATYQGQTVFRIDIYAGPGAGIGTVYRCDGSVLCKAPVTIAGSSGGCNGIKDAMSNSKLIFPIPNSVNP